MFGSWHSCISHIHPYSAAHTVCLSRLRMFSSVIQKTCSDLTTVITGSWQWFRAVPTYLSRQARSARCSGGCVYVCVCRICVVVSFCVWLLDITSTGLTASVNIRGKLHCKLDQLLPGNKVVVHSYVFWSVAVFFYRHWVALWLPAAYLPCGIVVRSS